MGAHRKNPPAGAAKSIEDLASQGHSIIGIAKKLGVSRQTFQRWCEEDEAFQEAFELGREVQRQALISLLMQAAVINKGTNANAMFLLKTMHGFREQDSPNTKVNVGVAVGQNVLVVHDFGDDAEWEARAAAQQAALMRDAAHMPSPKPLELDAPAVTSQAIPAPVAPSWVPTWTPKT